MSLDISYIDDYGLKRDLIKLNKLIEEDIEKLLTRSTKIAYNPNTSYLPKDIQQRVNKTLEYWIQENINTGHIKYEAET